MGRAQTASAAQALAGAGAAADAEAEADASSLLDAQRRFYDVLTSADAESNRTCAARHGLRDKGS